MAQSADLYALPPCSIKVIDQNSILVLRLDNGATAGLDARWQSFLGLLQVFRTLPDHARVIVASVAELKGQEAGIEQALQTLLPRRILVSATDVLARYGSAARGALAPMTVCIRTCDQPASLERLLHGLGENQRRFSGNWPIEVYDDSRKAASIAANRALVDAAAPELAVAYVGREAQAGLMRLLCAAAPNDTDSLHWLLSADHPRHQHRPTAGLMANHLFLRHAGRRVLLLADGALPSAWTAQAPRWHTLIDNGERLGTAFMSHADGMRGLMPLAADPIALHARVLGQGLHAAVSTLAETPWAREALTGCPYAWAVAPSQEQAGVRHSINGVFGDTGAANDQGLLYQAPDAILPIVRDDAAYRQFRDAERCAFNADAQPTLFNAPRLPSVCSAGIDLASFMAPLLPAGHGGKALLGSLLRFLFPNDYGLSLPFALEQRAATATPWRFAAELMDQPPSPSAVLSEWVGSLPVPAGLDPTARLDLLAASLRCGDEQQVSRLSLAEKLANQLAVQRSRDQAFALSASRRALLTPSSGCPAWREDVTALGQHAATALQQARPLQPGLAEAIAADLHAYAEAVPAWTRAFARCQESGLGVIESKPGA